VNLTTENTEDTEFFWRNWDCGGAWFRAGDFMPQGRNRIKATSFIQDKNAGTNQKMNAIMSEWETFCDISYYHLWRVRRKNERGFNDGYHLQNGEEAQALVELLNGLERERGEVTKDLEFRRELYKVQEQYLETARAELSRERDEARAALMKIEDLFIDGTDIYADKEKMGIIARAALEGAK
jgi:hypothetical protein